MPFYEPIQSRAINFDPECLESNLLEGITHLEQPALAVFNDFEKYQVLKLDQHISIDEADQKMQSLNQKVCFVTSLFRKTHWRSIQTRHCRRKALFNHERRQQAAL